MAEPEMKSDRDNSKDREEGGDAIEEVNDVNNNGNSETDSSSVLAGLNLVMILSSLSSDDGCLNFEEIEGRGSGNSDQKGKICGSKTNLPARRRGGNGFRAAERQMSKVQTKIKDCRHCRKM